MSNFKGGDCAARAPEYRAWEAAKYRCHTKTSPKYPAYGGRGIIMCARWRGSYNAFLEDMGRKPSKEHSLDRIDVNGSYAPENCRWATSRQQARNRRDTVLIEYMGDKVSVADFSEQIGVSAESVKYHLSKGRCVDYIVALRDFNVSWRTSHQGT